MRESLGVCRSALKGTKRGRNSDQMFGNIWHQLLMLTFMAVVYRLDQAHTALLESLTEYCRNPDGQSEGNES